MRQTDKMRHSLEGKGEREGEIFVERKWMIFSCNAKKVFKWSWIEGSFDNIFQFRQKWEKFKKRSFLLN